MCKGRSASGAIFIRVVDVVLYLKCEVVCRNLGFFFWFAENIVVYNCSRILENANFVVDV